MLKGYAWWMKRAAGYRLKLCKPLPKPAPLTKSLRASQKVSLYPPPVYFFIPSKRKSKLLALGEGEC